MEIKEGKRKIHNWDTGSYFLTIIKMVWFTSLNFNVQFDSYSEWVFIRLRNWRKTNPLYTLSLFLSVSFPLFLFFSRSLIHIAFFSFISSLTSSTRWEKEGERERERKREQVSEWVRELEWDITSSKASSIFLSQCCLSTCGSRFFSFVFPRSFPYYILVTLKWTIAPASYPSATNRYTRRRRRWTSARAFHTHTHTHTYKHSQPNRSNSIRLGAKSTEGKW